LSFNISASIGLVSINNSSSSSTNILKATDAACYAAKDMGKNCVHIYSEDDADLTRYRQEMNWDTLIQRTLEDNHFFLLAQIISPTNIEKENQIHYEILLRMADENGNVVLPGKFLSAAERYGLVTKLDKWAVNDVFRKFEQYSNLESQPF